MMNQTIFKRYEYKYLLTEDQKKRSAGLYETLYETGQIRLHTYGRAQDDSEAFIELKKKYKKVVYKRRV